MPLNVKHWSGGITTDAFEQLKVTEWQGVYMPYPGSKEEKAFLQFASMWHQRAAESEARGSALVIFEIPEIGKHEIIAAVEMYLQTTPEIQLYGAISNKEEPKG